MDKISIAEVLSLLASGTKGTITYIRGSGKKRGTKKTIPHAIEGWNYTAFKKKRPLENILAINADTVSKQKTKGTIPIVDLGSDTQLTLYISHIIGWNGLKVIH